jgi:two-component system chemotaxis response regulator CheB
MAQMAHRDIIVIGASAGGIGVLETILAALPWDLRASLFIVLHTAEESPGLIPEILNRASKLPVLYAVHNAPILPARVYIAPAGARHMLLERGKIRLLPGPRENRSRPAIDALFRSASHAYGSQVIGVVLTGNLDDGAAGLADIKLRGGIAIVQNPDEADAPSMPASAIETTDVDYVLPVNGIAPKLVELAATEAVEIVHPINGKRNMPSSGEPYSCPECGGVLKEIKESGMVRFRCRVGHLYSPESLLADQGVVVEKALWAAIRTLEEQAEFAEKLATNSRKKQHARLAKRFSEKASVSRENASVLRELLQSAADRVFETPEERTGTQ